MKTFLLIIIIYITTISSQDEEARENDTIFLHMPVKKFYCDLRCGDSIHTLCEINKIELNRSICGPKFKVYEMENTTKKVYYSNHYIIEGFNGIRNRIARRMNVSNMIRVTHDKYLEKMARKILLRCEEYITKDKCTQFGGQVPGKRDYSTVVMTSFSQEIKFLHPNFIQYVLGTWYSEKNFMERPAFPPEINPDSPEDYGAITIDNNFTYLAHPEVEKVGCQLLRYKDFYQFLCVMWPYVGNRFIYKSGDPATSCPNEYPVKDKIFESLCAGFSVDKSKRVACSFALVVFCLIGLLWT